MNESLRPAQRRTTPNPSNDELDWSNVTYKITEQDDRTGSNAFEIWKKRPLKELMFRIMKKLNIQPGQESRTFKIVTCAAAFGKQAPRPVSVTYVDLPDDLDNEDMSDKARNAEGDLESDLDDDMPEDFGDDGDEGGQAGARYMALTVSSALKSNTRLMVETMRAQQQQFRDMNLANNRGGDIVDTVVKLAGVLTPIVVPLIESLKHRGDDSMKPVEMFKMGMDMASNAAKSAVAPSFVDYFGMVSAAVAGLGPAIAASRANAPVANPPALPPALPAPAANQPPALPAPAPAAPNQPATPPQVQQSVPARFVLYHGLAQCVVRNDQRKLKNPTYFATRAISEWPEPELTAFATATPANIVAEMADVFGKIKSAELPITPDHARALGALVAAIHHEVQADLTAQQVAQSGPKSAATPAPVADNTPSGESDEESEGDSDAESAATA